MVRVEGLEPSASRLRAEYSAIELHPEEDGARGWGRTSTSRLKRPLLTRELRAQRYCEGEVRRIWRRARRALH